MVFTVKILYLIAFRKSSVLLVDLFRNSLYSCCGVGMYLMRACVCVRVDSSLLSNVLFIVNINLLA